MEITNTGGDDLPPRVAAAGFLLPVILLAALSVIARTDGSAGPIAVSDAKLIHGVALELLMTATLGLWLWRRGWRPQRTATRPFVGVDVARGLVLWAVAIAVVVAWARVCRAAFPSLFTVAEQTQLTGAPHFWVSLPFSVLNAVFEEFLWLGLGVAALRRLGLATAAAISVALRVLSHAYQGPLALVTVVPIGILFTLYYVRTGRIWPIVVAHAFQDTLALALLTHMSGPGV
jgi:membrane protease YdiL (CAAX protease family)